MKHLRGLPRAPRKTMSLCGHSQAGRYFKLCHEEQTNQEQLVFEHTECSLCHSPRTNDRSVTSEDD